MNTLLVKEFFKLSKIILTKLSRRQGVKTFSLVHFPRNNKILLNTTFCITPSRRQMGDFGRQISQKYKNSINLLQFLLLQHAWSELEVVLFLKRRYLQSKKLTKFSIKNFDSTEKIRLFLTV